MSYSPALIFHIYSGSEAFLYAAARLRRYRGPI